MRLLLSSSSIDARRLPEHARPFIGGLVTPRVGRAEYWAGRSLPWAIDNDCFANWDPWAFLRLAARNRAVPGCLWVAVPDRVGDAATTLRRWRGWAPILYPLRLPLAFVGQDGITLDMVPWQRLGAVFLGGTTAWKLGSDAAMLAAEAKERGLWVHMGRVNSRKRVAYAASISCDSIDGLSFNRYSRSDLPWGLRWAATRQGRLWSAEEELSA